jgi:hypothetical protein
LLERRDGPRDGRGRVRVSSFPHFWPQNDRRPRPMRGPGRKNANVELFAIGGAIALQRFSSVAKFATQHRCTYATGRHGGRGRTQGNRHRVTYGMYPLSVDVLALCSVCLELRERVCCLLKGIAEGTTPSTRKPLGSIELPLAAIEKKR